MDVYKIEKLPMRPLIYGIFALYLFLDLVVVHGPLYRKLEPWIHGGDTAVSLGIENDWACTVNGEPITKDQLNLTIDLFLARRGQHRADLTHKNLSITQLAVLDQMINDKLIEQKTDYYKIDTPPEVIRTRIEQFEAQFAPGELKAVCEAHDLSQARLQQLLAAHARQQFWLEQYAQEFIDNAVPDPEAQAREWFEGNGDKLVVPEVVRARQLFLSIVDNDTPEREAQIRELHAKLAAGAKFEELVSQSEDERSKKAGGDLGFFSRSRMPPEFTEPVFKLQPGQTSEPFKTKIGWHIVEVTDRNPERPMTWDEARPEILTFLENEWRAFAVDKFVSDSLRTANQSKLVFFPAAKVIDKR